jgi:hypothetical protein
MGNADPAHEFIAASFASLGIEVDEIDMAVSAAAHNMFWPSVLELLSIDTSDVVPERDPDLSRAPEPL